MATHSEGSGPPPAVAASDGAAMAAGGGAVGDAVQGCLLIRTGVFFDGTGNFRGNVGNEGASWYTNVDLLQRVYEENLEDDTEVTFPNGLTRVAKTWSAYHRGIGIKPGGGAARIRGQGLGVGPEGVDARVKEAVMQLNQEVSQNSGGERPCDIWIDTFGFSRGATAARDFANEIHDGAGDNAATTYRQTQRGRRVDQRGPKPVVKYMGIFDTVSSVGWPGDMDGTFWVDLTTRGRAESICHITARDEFRSNFPLTRAAGREIAMAGTHGDIGGGWEPGPWSRTFTYENAGVRAGFTQRLIADYGVTPNGPPGPGGETLVSVRSTEYVAAPGAMMAAPIEVENNAFTATAEHGLQFVSLRLVHHWGIAVGVPFPPELGNSIEGISIAIPGDLQSYFAGLRDNPGGVSEATHAAMRHKYSHFSVSNSIVNTPEWDGERRSMTL